MSDSTQAINDVRRRLFLVLGPILSITLAVTCALWTDMTTAQVLLVGVTTLTAFWWVTEALPVPATSLIPLAALPILGITSHRDTAASYGDSLILLLMGGFMMSKAMESNGAHRRIAVALVRGAGRLGGDSPRVVILGFMVASGFLSMWISNTATTLMLLPVALAVISGSQDRRIAVPLLLGLAYAANIGGIGTPIGTPPNVIFMGAIDTLPSTTEPFGFVRWMAIGVPVVVIMIPLAWIWLTRRVPSDASFSLPAPERWTRPQITVVLVFGLAAFLWITQKYPTFTIPGLEATRTGGWTGLIYWFSGGVVDARLSGSATVAILIVLLMFLTPTGGGGRLLVWDDARRIPWGILLLFGGGIALARAFQATELSEVIANQLSLLRSVPIPVVIIVICLFTTFLTEITSNTALTALLMPILASTAQAIDVDPVVLMAPAAMSASCAFMLPVATAPNAVVYGSDLVPIRTMMREGFVLNLIGVAVISIAGMIVASTVETDPIAPDSQAPRPNAHESVG